jgi:hypothetical protein
MTEEEIKVAHALVDRAALLRRGDYDGGLVNGLGVALSKALEALNFDRASVRLDALLEAARIMCWKCSEKHTVVLSKGVYKHAVSGELGLIECDAHYILELIADEKGQE